MPRQGLALDLSELEIEPLEASEIRGTDLDTIGYGHGMTEANASVSGGGCACCSCCIACCCCCT